MYIDIPTGVNIALTVVTFIMAIAICYMPYSTQYLTNISILIL